MRLAQLKGYEERQQTRQANVEGSVSKTIKSPVRAAVRAVGLLRPAHNAF